MEFTKMQGAGNDFIFILDWDLRCYQAESKIAQKLCDRHFGLGADGVVFVRKSQVADGKMVIINSDGSKANMCGNALRCFVKYLFEKGIVEKNVATVETGDGIKEVTMEILEDKVIMARAEMGKPSFEPYDIPLTINEKIISKTMEIEGVEYELTTLLMGVPHTIVIKENEEYNVNEGVNIEKHPVFKEGTNVNFVNIIDRENINIKTWERGAGATLCCGTGCSAAAYALNYLGLVDAKVNVHAPGGTLVIEIIDGNVYMSGKAQFVCEGIAY